MIELNKLTSTDNIPLLVLFFIVVLAAYKAKGIYAIEDPEEKNLAWTFFFIIFGVALLSWAICNYVWNYSSIR